MKKRYHDNIHLAISAMNLPGTYITLFTGLLKSLNAQTCLANVITVPFPFKPDARWPQVGAPGFLKLILCGSSVCMFMCPRPRLLITSGVMWYYMDFI